MTSSLISLPSAGSSEQAGWVIQREQRAPKPAVSQGRLLDWTHRQSDHGVVLSARIAGAGASACVHMALDDRQLRALTIDLVRAAMVRGIAFEGRRKWWRVW